MTPSSDDPAESHARMLEADESNLTWAGRRLLKPRYLDELPQIWNVFRGDMSLVGPRPWPPSMVATQVAKGFTYRNEFVAGWTGPAQVEKGVTESSGYAGSTSRTSSSCRRAGAWELVRNDLGSSGERSWSWRRAKVCDSDPGRRYGSVVPNGGFGGPTRVVRRGRRCRIRSRRMRRRRA